MRFCAVSCLADLRPVLLPGSMAQPSPGDVRSSQGVHSSRLIAAGLFFALALLAAIAASAYFSITGFVEGSRLVARTQELLYEADLMLSDLKDAEGALRGYILSGQDESLGPYREALLRIPGRITRLEELAAEERKQRQRVDKLRPMIETRLRMAQQTIAARRPAAAASSRDLPGRMQAGKELMDQIRDLVAEMRDEGTARVAQRAERSERTAQVTKAIMIAGYLASFSILVAGFAILRREARHRTHAVQEARKLAAEVEDLYNRAPCGYHSVDKDGVILRINDTELSWLGYERNELIGKKSIGDLMTPQSLRLFRESFPRFKATGMARDMEFDLVRKDGTILPVSISASAIYDHDGNFSASRSLLFDITDRRNAERQRSDLSALLDSLAETISSMIFVKDAHGLGFVRINRAGEELLGLSREELIGKCDYDLFPTEQADHFTAVDREALSAASVVDIPEERIQTRGKGTRVLHTRKVAVRDEAGAPRYLLAISEDITEKKFTETRIDELNATLEQRTGQLEAVNRELDSFAYSVSHDLRSPLRAIDGFTRILEEEHGPALGEEGRRLMKVIRDNCDRMARLIEHLLGFSRLGRQPLTVGSVDMAALVREAFSELKLAHDSAELVVGDLPPARGDSSLLRQVWLNLLSNALKYSSRAEPPRVEVGTLASVDAGRGVTYFIKDNGVGFDMRYVHKLFGVFQRLHRETEFPGTGVGLAIVQRIVSRHGGRVWAEGETGRGATFCFFLPDGGVDRQP